MTAPDPSLARSARADEATRDARSRTHHHPRPNRPDPLLRSRAAVTVELHDSEAPGRAVNLVFAATNVVILVALFLAGIGLFILAVAPASMTGSITHHQAGLPVANRITLCAGSFACLITLRLYGRRLEDVWRWARLDTEGAVTLNDLGMTIEHPAVLASSTFVPWRSLDVIAVDDGSNDSSTIWRRFPVIDDEGRRTWLFATDGTPLPDSVLISGRPTPPNVALVLNTPVTMHNPHVAASDVAFPPVARAGMPSRPPREQTTSALLFLRVADPEAFRHLVSSTNIVRDLKKIDLPGLF